MTRVTALLVVSATFFACAKPDAAPEHSSPAHVENPVHEGDLTLVRLDPAAVTRLGIETVLVQEGPVSATLEASAEVIAVPGSAVLISAPLAGQIRELTEGVPGTSVEAGEVLARLTPLAPAARDTKAIANREVESAKADLIAAELRLERAEKLAEGRAGSQRAVEEATAGRNTAAAALRAAQARSRTTRATPLLSDVTMTVRAPAAGVLRSVTVASGQSVASGAPLFEIVDVDALWIRAQFYAGDLTSVASATVAEVAGLGATSARRSVEPVPGPPTATPAANTVDRYYKLAANETAFALGERVIVSVPAEAEASVRSIPASAIFHDANGTTWVYVCESETAFRRAPVDVARTVEGVAVLGRGPAAGSCVVSVGAAELFGTEFEPGH
ncbi:MAG: efflux RND transporter periplasmic adaptor subunit [Nannocystales bacterium]